MFSQLKRNPETKQFMKNPAKIGDCIVQTAARYAKFGITHMKGYRVIATQMSAAHKRTVGGVEYPLKNAGRLSVGFLVIIRDNEGHERPIMLGGCAGWEKVNG